VRHGVVQGIGNQARQGAVAGPVDGITKAFEQREGQRNGYPLLTRSWRGGVLKHAHRLTD
jgi:hypothetical protein